MLLSRLPLAIFALHAGLGLAVPAGEQEEEAGRLQRRQVATPADEPTTTIRVTTTVPGGSTTVSTTVFTTVFSTILETSTAFATSTVTSSNVDTATVTNYVTSTIMAKRWLPVPMLPTPTPTTSPDDLDPYRRPELITTLAPAHAGFELARRALTTETVTLLLTTIVTITRTITSTVVSVSSGRTTLTSTITSVTFENAKTTITVTSTLVVTSTSVSVVPTVYTTAVGPTVTVPGESGETGGSTPDGSGGGGGGGSSPLSTGAKIGIGVGAGVGGLILIALLAWLCLRSRKGSGNPYKRPPTVDFTPTSYPMAEPTIPNVGDPSILGAGLASTAGSSPPPKYPPNTPSPVGGYRGVAPSRPLSDDVGMAAAAAVGQGAYNRAHAASPVPTELSGQPRYSAVLEMDATGAPAHGPGGAAVAGHGHSRSNASELDSASATGTAGTRLSEIDGRPVRMSHVSGPVQERYEMP